MRIIMFSLVIVSIMSTLGCRGMSDINVKPSTTTVTYGRDNSSGEKDAKNDVLTNNEKESWTIKQVFKWE